MTLICLLLNIFFQPIIWFGFIWFVVYFICVFLLCNRWLNQRAQFPLISYFLFHMMWIKTDSHCELFSCNFCLYSSNASVRKDSEELGKAFFPPVLPSPLIPLVDRQWGNCRFHNKREMTEVEPLLLMGAKRGTFIHNSHFTKLLLMFWQFCTKKHRVVCCLFEFILTPADGLPLCCLECEMNPERENLLD